MCNEAFVAETVEGLPDIESNVCRSEVFMFDDDSDLESAVELKETRRLTPTTANISDTMEIRFLRLDRIRTAGSIVLAP